MAERPRFLADEMLGSLARWLRIMGYDTTYARDRGDTEILRTAAGEGRLLLTRDHQLAERAGEGGLLIESDELEDQLRQVVAVFDLKFDKPLTRCTLCNGELTPVSVEEAGGQVPDRVREAGRELFRCQECGQLYWEGTHWKRIGERISKVMDEGDQRR